MRPVWIAYLARFEFAPDLQMLKQLFFTWPYVVVLQYLVLVAFGVPSFSWRYVGVREAVRIGVATLASSAVLLALRLGLAGLGWYFTYVTLPLGIILMNCVLAYVGIAGIRMLRRIMAERQERRTRHGGAMQASACS